MQQHLYLSMSSAKKMKHYTQWQTYVYLYIPQNKTFFAPLRFHSSKVKYLQSIVTDYWWDECNHNINNQLMSQGVAEGGPSKH